MDSVRPPAWKILLAFAIVYFVWGSTFLAIRVGVQEMPPFLMAAMRFWRPVSSCWRGCAPVAPRCRLGSNGRQRRCWRS